MNATAVKSDTTLELRRTFNASQERVYQAWTQPEHLAQWFHPTAQHRGEVSELDLRIGGRYRISMIAGENVHTIGGTYQQIDPPQKIAFTWQWEGEEGAVETLVTVEFNPIDPNNTEVILLHERFPTVEERDNHNWGWNGTLTQFEAYLSL